MEYKLIKIGELEAFVGSRLYLDSKNCPITRHRAHSQLKNPRANADDPALLLAVSNENIVGYIGFLPDEIGGETVYWNSCWWVAKEYKSIAVALLLQFIKIGKERIVLTDFTPHTEEIVRQLRFFEMTNLEEGFRGYLRFNLAELLPRKYPWLNVFRAFLRPLDYLANGIVGLRNKGLTFKVMMKVEEVANLTEDDSAFIAQQSKNELMKRGRRDIQWIRDFPWVKESSHDYSHYYFSSSSTDFETKVIRLTNEEKVCAIIYFRRLNRHLTVPYLYFQKTALKEVVNIVLNEAIVSNCITFTTFNPMLKKSLESTSAFIKKVTLQKKFAYHKSIKAWIHHPVVLQDGDGDAAFC